ncbi:MAG TPA: hypothetical protein EYQ63_07940 [Fuerstia sp.]|nr:hypothetical protein [Fuerstiella sp.]
MIRHNRFRHHMTQERCAPRTLMLCLLWSLTCGCGEAEKPATTPPADSAKPTTGQRNDFGKSSSPQTEEFTPLRTLSSAHDDQQVAVRRNVAATEPAGSDESAPLKVRLPDDRPDLNDARLAQAGIRRYESRRLILLSDLPEDTVAHLPALADQLFERLELHFGTLPGSLDDSDFQVTGHLIDDEQKFRAAGLMPSETFTFDHGRHWNYQFWMFNTNDEYYRRHLLLHEFTHCFMTCETGMLTLPDSWYMEGMAEYFATHQLPKDAGGSDEATFGVLPAGFEGFDGWGRISEIRRSFQERGSRNASDTEPLTIPTLDEVMPDDAKLFTRYSQYATAWALCWFLQSHPHYRDVFRPLARLRTRAEITTTIKSLRKRMQPRIKIDWLLFVESLREDFDIERSFPVHSKTTITTTELKTAVATFELQAAIDWQDSGLRLAAGESVKVSCSGRFSVNDHPQRWMSEPQGISIDYFRGLPLGQVVATLVGTDGNSISSRISVGTGTTITTAHDVSVWLQVNDSSASRRHNAGVVDVEFSLPQQ